MQKKQAKMLKTVMYLWNNLSKSGNSSMYTEECCDFDRLEHTEYIRNRIQNSFSDLGNWEQEKWDLLEPMKSSGSNPKK